MTQPSAPKIRKPSLPPVPGRCLCGGVRLEIGFPARWAWHDHTPASRRAHGAAYATYLGCYRSRFWITDGADLVTEFQDAETRTTRHFCARCGTPIFYVRAHSPTMVNVPRALFETRTGREPLYHIGIEHSPEWAYGCEPLKPLKGFPGVVWTGPKRRKKRGALEGMF